MMGNQIMASEWLARNRDQMIFCPYQPGKLIISKYACSKRHDVGRKEDYQDLMKGDFFSYTYKRGLSLCRNCPIGKKLTSKQRAH